MVEGGNAQKSGAVQAEDSATPYIDAKCKAMVPSSCRQKMRTVQ